MKYRNGSLRIVLLTFHLLWMGLTYCAAKVGDIAQGVIVKENEKGLVLQEDPCDRNSAVITFSAPWKKSSLGKKKCSDNKSYDIFQIEQLAPATLRKQDKEEHSGEPAPRPSPDERDREPPNERNRR
jgi:hypothetical protein